MILYFTMSEYIEINNKKFIPGSAAAKAVGYTNDYVTKLAREGKIDGLKIGRRWMVSETAIWEFAEKKEKEKTKRNERIRQERLVEQEANGNHKKIRKSRRTLQESNTHSVTPRSLKSGIPIIDSGRNVALLQTCTVFAVSILIAATSQITFDERQLANASRSGSATIADAALWLYEFISPPPQITTETAGQTGRESETTEGRSEKYGLVVLPAEEEERLQSIRNAFSDEVEIELDPEVPEEGVIRPRFRDRLGDPYNFLFVLLRPD